jgi:hypothetical protein
MALAAPVFSAGCAVLSSDTSSTETKNALTVSVREAPPPEKEQDPKDRPSSPGFGFIWVSGYWDYLDGNYVWRDGRWVQGKPDWEYVRARYEQVNGAWVFHRPHWKKRHGEGGGDSNATAKSTVQPTG